MSEVYLKKILLPLYFLLFFSSTVKCSNILHLPTFPFINMLALCFTVWGKQKARHHKATLVRGSKKSTTSTWPAALHYAFFSDHLHTCWESRITHDGGYKPSETWDRKVHRHHESTQTHTYMQESEHTTMVPAELHGDASSENTKRTHKGFKYLIFTA